MSFLEASVAAAKEYVRTVVFIDDNAYNLYRQSPDQEPQDTTEQDAFNIGQQEVGETEIPGEGQNEGFDPESIDSKAIVHCFAEHRLICSLIKPAPIGFEPSVLEAAKLADLVVLDWDLYKDGGNAAKQYAEKLVAGDAEESLRVTIVYTGNPENEIARFANDLFETLGGGNNGCFKVDDYTIQKKHSRVAFYGKTAFAASRHVTFTELPTKLIEEFSMLSSGLLSNAVLTSIGRVRRETPKLVAKFSPLLDDAYLLHRALLDKPEDAEEHVLPLICDEIRAIIDTSDWRAGLNLTKLEEFLNDHHVTSAGRFKSLFKTGNSQSALIREALEFGVIRKTYLEKTEVKGSEIRKFKSPISKETNALGAVEGQAGITNADKAWSVLLSQESIYNRPGHLRLGTIVRENEGDFLLCLQPVCDSIRLKEDTDFPFLRLQISSKDAPFNFIILQGDEEFLLRHSKPELSLIRVLKFSPDAVTETVVPQKTKKYGYHFKRSSSRYFICGQLRYEHALRIVNTLASHSSRIGLTESEWQRIQVKN